MPGKTLIAPFSGLAAGVALTMAASESIAVDSLSGVALLAAATVLPMIVIALFILAAMDRRLRTNEERIRQGTTVQVEQRRALQEEFARCSAELNRRETRLNLPPSGTQPQSSVLAAQLAEALKARDEAVQRAEEWERDYEVLAHEYNGMALGEVRHRAAQFAKPGRMPAPRERRRERAVTEQPASPPRTASRTEPEHHSRPAEG
ncbi:hypothetical protein ACFU6S_06495 [Streptomyces sp. NPDC057456]|uniref:hypothetical protein n=1 Tax=Streptomyces sp. NPDC057456 TaxID=3346139 RepID=UPI00368A0BBE